MSGSVIRAETDGFAIPVQSLVSPPGLLQNPGERVTGGGIRRMERQGGPILAGGKQRQPCLHCRLRGLQMGVKGVRRRLGEDGNSKRLSEKNQGEQSAHRKLYLAA